jgi:hypothetical protein
MLGTRLRCGFVVPVAWVGLVGCGGSPASPEYHPAPPGLGPNPQAILAKLRALSDAGQGRYPLSTHTHADVSRWYLAELDAIDLSGCPAEFAEKFRGYRQAWEAVRRRSQEPAEAEHGIKSYAVLFQQLKDELLPQGLANGRDDDALLNELLLRARELKRAAGA